MALTAFSIEPAASPPFGVSIPDGQVRLAAVVPEAAFGHFRPLGARPRKSALGRRLPKELPPSLSPTREALFPFRPGLPSLTVPRLVVLLLANGGRKRRK
jgi:hypothetical protein